MERMLMPTSGKAGYTLAKPVISHTGIKCDSCGKMPITGPRFKCAYSYSSRFWFTTPHANCPATARTTTCVKPVTQGVIAYIILPMYSWSSRESFRKILARLYSTKTCMIKKIVSLFRLWTIRI